ncbi:MAG: molybdenum cofactor guanylyltransferase [Nanoarchaeota archaeon]|nr:molybdenum cofactor guanylyltransferase [Nanoarchaeota archaeon]
MLPKKNICCAVLAGGKAERLPYKPFILLKGKPLVSYALDSAEEYFDETIIIAKKQQEEKLEKITQNKSKIKIIIENSNDFSPWNGIKAAVRNTEAEWIFLLACDMPFVCAELFDLMASKINPDIDCIIPCSERLQPLCALYRKTVLEKAPFEGSVTRFAESLKKEVVRIDNANWFFNINAKEDFEEAGEMMKNIRI